MPLISGSIPWEPKSKERPRHNGNISFTPKPTRDAEAAIVAELARQGLIPEDPLDDPLQVGVWFGEDHFYFEVDTCAPWEQKGMHRDVDNMGKLVLDAFDQVLFLNDKQVTDLRLVKM